jgi:hypothetical protein
MATLASLVDRVRVELGDLGKSFVTQFVADGSTNRFKLHYSPLDGNGVTVFQNGTDVSNEASVEESTGVLVMDTLPADGDEFTVSGNYYRYFTQTEMEMLVNDAIIQHTGRTTDPVGRQITVANLPTIEEYPIAIYAVTLALYTLATDSAFDIDIQAPDGVTIPRTERYRQLMEMVQTRREQYRELCTMLGVGMYKIDVMALRRISKATGRYVPVYKPQEVDDRSYPQRVDLPQTTYGDQTTPWPTESVELTSYQGRAFTTVLPDIDLSNVGVDLTEAKYADSTFVVKILPQRAAPIAAATFTIDDTNNDEDTDIYSFTVSLTRNQTLLLAGRTYWSVQISNIDGEADLEIAGGNFFTVRRSRSVV